MDSVFRYTEYLYFLCGSITQLDFVLEKERTCLRGKNEFYVALLVRHS